jgi:hypothetical protein
MPTRVGALTSGPNRSPHSQFPSQLRDLVPRATASVWLEEWFQIVCTAGGLHDGNCGGEDTIEGPEESLGGGREEDAYFIASKLFERGVGRLFRLA